MHDLIESYFYQFSVHCDMRTTLISLTLVLIQTLSAAFQRKDTNRNGWIQINYEEFMELVFSTKI
jgi:hypothetical protein